MKNLLRSFSVVLAAAVLSLGGCATTSGSQSGDALDDQPVLILATQDYELHLRGGEVVMVRTKEDGPATSATEEKVQSYQKFKNLYELRSGEELPPVMPEGGVVVTGWRGLDCVRPGRSCGPQPAEPSQENMVKVKVTFGR